MNASIRNNCVKSPCLTCPEGCGSEAFPPVPAPKSGIGAATDWEPVNLSGMPEDLCLVLEDSILCYKELSKESMNLYE